MRALIETHASSPPEVLARVHGLERAVLARLGPWESWPLTPAERHHIRRLLRFVTHWSQADGERRARGIPELLAAVDRIGTVGEGRTRAPDRPGLPAFESTEAVVAPAPPARPKPGGGAPPRTRARAEVPTSEPTADLGSNGGAPRRRRAKASTGEPGAASTAAAPINTTTATPVAGLSTEEAGRGRDKPAPRRSSVAQPPVGPETIEALRGVGPVLRDAFHAAGLRTVDDLLHRLPKSFLDRRVRTPIGALEPGDEAQVWGRIDAVRSGRARGSFEAMVSDGEGRLRLRWFQAPPWLRDRLCPGVEVLVCGRVEQADGGGAVVVHPELSFGDDGAGIHHSTVVPRYAAVDGVGLRPYRAFVHQAFDRVEGRADPLPPRVRTALAVLSRREALRALHHPSSEDDVSALSDGSHPAYRALWAADLMVLQVALAERRQRLGPPPTLDLAAPAVSDAARAVAEALPFTPTDGQAAALAVLRSDLRAGRPMQRLLLGDVGSGKTLVAVQLAADVIAAGAQVAVLAPTEVLARQWFDRVKVLLAPMGARCGLLLGGAGARARREQRAAIEGGEWDLCVGTHALAQGGVRFDRLALVVVDEQQRFGVLERARVVGKGVEPHLLAMTATPIPRTLALGLWGDLDLLTLPDRPRRSTITTSLRPMSALDRSFSELREALGHGPDGGRAYVVCPRIEGETDDEDAVLPLAERLVEGPLSGVPLAVLHGGMGADDKERAIGALRDGRVRVLVATTVVEVGVDVPDATHMIVVEADRLGLSQLHQLRGRVGRGDRPGTCWFFHRRADPGRLSVLAESRDGFRIAEEDLRTRGPGDLLGLRQSGEPAMRALDDERARDLVERCHALAREIVAGPQWADERSQLADKALALLDRAVAPLGG